MKQYLRGFVQLKPFLRVLDMFTAVSINLGKCVVFLM